MNFVYKKDHFTLQDLMTEFKISKSTALRYITALEDIGIPLYSEKGRYGGYKLLETYKIPPITFTPQETYALFFSIKGMELLKSMPFQAEYSTIQEKFLNSVSSKIKNTLEQLNSRISFGTVKITNECPMLEKFLYSIMKPSVLKIIYQTSDRLTERRIQPIGIFAEYGNWYCPSFDIDINEYRLFRCDRIKKIVPLSEQPIDNIMKFDLINRFELVKRSSSAIDFKIEISEEGKSIYERFHYPNMSFEEINRHFFIVGWIEPGEIEFLLNYIHQFGQYLVNIYPNSIKQNFLEHLETIKNKLK
jgi:predicted DNA-binding transcriptional regulator YafY